jgi:hypothetical protein
MCGGDVVVPSLRTLLDGILDYAGLFPPARLSLDQAIRNYASYRRGPESWMLGRFVCPASRLAELAPYRDELFSSGPPFAFAVLLRPTESADHFLVGLRTDLEAVAAFTKYQGDRVVVDMAEFRLPMSTPSADGVSELLEATGRIVAAQGPPVVQLYAELPPGSDWRSPTAAVVAALAYHNACTTPARLRGSLAGFKLRCGGLEPAACPSPEQVAGTITACRDAGVLLKFTAGLHHPLRHFDPGVRTVAHGFLNVFTAGVLAHARGLGTADVRRIIEDEDAGHFAFDAQWLRWQDHRATTAEVAAARKSAVTSFGSCSFDEPRDGLRALGLLGEDAR